MEAAVSTEKVTSAHVRNALKLRYPKDSHALLWEVPPGTGMNGGRYTDAVAVGLYASHGHKIEGIEIKVSRSDFLHEMKQPEKSAPVFKFCTHWWLACPQGMVHPDELPSTWGMLELMPNGTMRTRHKAPKLTPAPVTLAFFAALCRRHAGLDEVACELLLSQERQKLQAEFKERVQRAADERASLRIQKAEEGMKQLADIEERTGIDFSAYGMADDFIRSVLLVQELTAGNEWSSVLKALRRNLSAALKEIDESGLLQTAEGEPS